MVFIDFFKKLFLTPTHERLSPVVDPKEAIEIKRSFNYLFISLCLKLIEQSITDKKNKIDYLKENYPFKLKKTRILEIIKLAFQDKIEPEVIVKKMLFLIGSQGGIKIKILSNIIKIMILDDYVSVEEMRIAHNIANLLGIKNIIFLELVKAHYIRSDDSIYELMGISKNSSDEEVQKKYQEISCKIHPDVVNRIQYIDPWFRELLLEKSFLLQKLTEKRLKLAKITN